MGIALQTMTNELTHVFLLSVGAFLLAMFLTPIYTFFAYRYRFWKRQRSESTDGKKLKIFAKFQAAKLRRNIPTMAGVIGVISIFVVTIFFNLDRAQTWLPLAALVGGGIVALCGLVMIFTSPHRIERVMTFVQGDSHKGTSSQENKNYHIQQARIAIGSGGLLGLGIGKSVQATGYLPEATNDSIFAVMGETFGFVGLCSAANSKRVVAPALVTTISAAAKTSAIPL
jgi:hypothetical protein